MTTKLRSSSFDFVLKGKQLNVSYRSWGEGPVILFVHGLMGSSKTWNSVINDLPQQYQYVAIDLPGFGKTAPLAPEEITIAYYAKILEKVIEAINENSQLELLVSDSLGARVTLEMLRTHSLNSNGLILSGCPIEEFSKLALLTKFKGLIAFSLRALRIIPNFVIVPVIKVLSYVGLNHLRRVDSAILDEALSADPKTVENMMFEIFKAFPITDLQNCNHCKTMCKSLIIRGIEDQLISSKSARDVGKVFGAKVVELENVGHTPMLEDSAQYGKVISAFLEN